MKLLKELHYEEQMNRDVMPFLESRRESGFFERASGCKIYYEHYRADQPKGCIVLVHGFSESLPKFCETIYYFLCLGYDVWAIQQREHGLSCRSTEDPALIYIEDFKDLIKDLHYFVRKIVKKSEHWNGLPHILYGHSMGGGVSACYLSCYPEDFDKAILSSPMLELNSGGTPALAAQVFARVMVRHGHGADYMPGAAPFRDQPDLDGSCTSCEARYNYWFAIQREHPQYQMCVPAIRTAQQLLKITKFAMKPKHIAAITADVLLFQAGRDTMVKRGGQEKFARLLGPRANLVRFPDARHEIYFERDAILEAYWAEIEKFL